MSNFQPSPESSWWLTRTQIVQHCHTTHNIDVADIVQLPSYDDQNFRIATRTGVLFVLKVAKSEETRANLIAQHRVIHHLSTHAPSWLRVSLPQNSTQTDGVFECAGRLVRLLTWVDGSTFKSCTVKSDALLQSAGRMIGTITAALSSMPTVDLPFSFNADWRMELSASTYLPMIDEIFPPGDERHTLVRDTLRQFETYALPKVAGLRSSVVHMDLNEYNVFASAGAESPQVSGVIDFGDANVACTVFDVAIAFAYLALDSTDPLRALRIMVAACHAVFPLTDDELAVLWFCTRARLAVSLCKSALTSRAQPANAAYLLASALPAIDLLRKTSRVHPRFAVAAMFAACGKVAPLWRPALSLLSANTLDVHPLMDELRGATASDLCVFDMSVGKLACAPDNVNEFRAHLNAELARSGAKVGIGRYLEWRDMYAADGFRPKVAANDDVLATHVADARSCHLGVDLNVPCGTPLYAMLDGRVHSIANNALPLDYGPTVILEHSVDGVTFYTLYGHLQADSIAHLQVGSVVPRGALFCRVGASTENGGWPEHVHVQIIVDMLDLSGDFVGAAAGDDVPVYRALCPDPNALLRLPCNVEARAVSIDDLVSKRAQYTLPNMSLSFATSSSGPLNVRRGVGAYLVDERNRRFLDCVNNVAHVGHSNAVVHAAVCRQLAVLNTNSRYLLDSVPLAVDALKTTLPAEFGDAYVAFTNSGSESNDLALRLARTFVSATRHRDAEHAAIIVLNHGYHGHTGATMAVSAYKFFDQMRLPAPPSFVRVVALPGESAVAPLFASVADAIDACVAARVDVCAFIHESIVGCGGQIPLPAEFVRAAYAAVRAAGGVCIADEVQTGLGRCGGVWHAFERLGVVPDIVTCAKPLGNGMPIGAVVCQRRIGERFGDTGAEYFNTFGGNPVCAAAVSATIGEVRRLMPAAMTTSTLLFSLLNRLRERHGSLVRDVRGVGLFVGIELPDEASTRWVVDFARARRVLLSTDGPRHNVIKIKPPLVFGELEARVLARALDEALTALTEARQQRV
jgi:4-aminobutyrate aminotransferase-like enzyme/Ser/Thr protein kinase RdoA (MazF antagonist)